MTLPEPPSGCFDGAVHLFPLRVYFEDTDVSGVVYHANYLRWFDRARADMLRLLGIEQRPVHDAGEGAYAVSELAIRYSAPARLDDAVVVRSTAEELRGASLRIDQAAWRDATLLARAQLRIAFVAPGGRPRRQPRAWYSAIESLINPLEKHRNLSVS
ncbi:MAG: YbgC/FadM family acyl-CoA thioesterase [Novosphingobium sp.]